MRFRSNPMLIDVSKEDLEDLQRVVREVQNRSISSPRYTDENSLMPLVPEVYVAKVTDTIPGLIPGSGTAPDEPGKADCDIYQIVDGLLIPTGFTESVSNISTADIGESWLQINREKYGTWLAVPTATSGSIIVEESDLAPSYSGITKIDFLVGDFILSSSSPGQVLVASAGLTVKPITSGGYTGIKIFEFDTAMGFILSNPVAGKARITL